MRLHTPALALLILLFPTACASSASRDTPRHSEARIVEPLGEADAVLLVQNESSVSSFLVDAPADRVWRELQVVYAALGLPVGELDPNTMRMGHGGFPMGRIDGERMSRYVDCGTGLSGPNTDRFIIVLTLYATVVPRSSSASELVIDLDGQGKPRAYSGNWMHCGSLRTLERLIVERIEARLEGTARGG